MKQIQARAACHANVHSVAVPDTMNGPEVPDVLIWRSVAALDAEIGSKVHVCPKKGAQFHPGAFRICGAFPAIAATLVNGTEVCRKIDIQSLKSLRKS